MPSSQAIHIITQRLSMRQITQDDWPLFYELHTDPAVIDLCFDAPDKASLLEKFKARLAPWSSHHQQWLSLVITERKTGEVLGITGFCLKEGVAEVGYLLRASAQGKGIGTESLQAVIDWAKSDLGVKQFKAVVTEGNIASERVLEKCGFTLLQTIADAYQIGDTLYADRLYQMG